MAEAARSLVDDRGPGGAVVETAASAVAAREKAEVEARYVMALRRPRDMDEVRVRLLKECERPGFAEVAKYEKPVGGQKIVGLSIRFAEAALRCMTNVMPQVLIVFDDSERRILRVSVTDLENNLTYGQDVILEKTVERRKVKDGQTVIGDRVNSSGDRVFIVLATEDELMTKMNAAISKVLRNHGLRLIPGDILDECSARIDKTFANKAAQDPEGEKKKVVDSFAAIGVMPTRIAEYLGHAIEQIVPAELAELRRIYQSIRDGETTWSSVMEAKGGEAGGDGRPKPVRKAPEAGAAPAAGTPGPEPAPTAPADPPPAPAAKPDGGAKPKMETVSKLYELAPRYNRKHGDGSFARDMNELYGVDAPSKLTGEQASEFLAKMEASLK